MNKSAHSDRERRRTKAQRKVGWANYLIRPSTLKLAINGAIAVTRVIWIAYRLVLFWRE